MLSTIPHSSNIWIPSELILFCLCWGKSFLTCGSNVLLASLSSHAFLSGSGNQSWRCWDIPYNYHPREIRCCFLIMNLVLTVLSKKKKKVTVTTCTAFSWNKYHELCILLLVRLILIHPEVYTHYKLLL